MVLMKFNKDFKNKDDGKLIKANTPVDVTLKRADEIVENINKLAETDTRFKAWEGFNYERVKEEVKEGKVVEEEVAEEGE